MGEARDALESMTEFDSAVYAAIDSVKPGNVTIQDLAVTDDTVTINCNTTSNVPPAGFAEALDKMDIFGSVGYSGFKDAGDGTFSFR
jgi:hypothetical protein